MRRPLTISENLLLLMTKDDGRAEGSYAAYGYAAGNITDLLLAERVAISDDKDPRVTVVNSSPTGNAALDAALARLGEKDGKKISRLVTDGKVAASDRIVDALAADGVIRVEEKKMLGLVPEKHPVLDPTPERDLREELRLVLAGGSATPQVATLLSVLQGLDVAHKVLAAESNGMSKKDLKRRIEQIAADVDTGAASTAVKKAVDSINTAILTAAILPSITAATMGSS